MNGIVKWGILAFIAWWVIIQPSAAAEAVRHLAALASHAATSLATVVASI